MQSGQGAAAPVTIINTGNVGTIEKFRISDDWEIFAERLEQFFIANKVEEERKTSILLTSISEDTYKILKNLCFPEKPMQKSLQQLLDLLTDQFKLKRSHYRKRREFDQLRQTNETVNEWYVKVKQVAAQCEFGNDLVGRVTDKFVVGMCPGPVFNKLCEQPLTTTLRELLELALTKEATIREDNKPEEVNKVQPINKEIKDRGSSQHWMKKGDSYLFKPNVRDDVDSKIEVLMNGAVKEALDITQNWGENNMVFNYLVGDFMKPVTSIVERLLNETDLTVAVYNGQLDLIVDTPGTIKWVDNLQWPGTKQWSTVRRTAFTVNNYYEGYVKKVKNLYMYWINRSGHMVPADNPAAMSYILKDVTNYST